jgi:phosphoribosylaminoimidazole carboxylase (NCAIR synthetase)
VARDRRTAGDPQGLRSVRAGNLGGGGAQRRRRIEGFDVTENEHRDHILKTSRAPAEVSSAVASVHLYGKAAVRDGLKMGHATRVFRDSER